MIIFSVPIIPEYLYTIRHQYDKTTTTTTRITTTTTTISTIPPGISKIRIKSQNWFLVYYLISRVFKKLFIFLLANATDAYDYDPAAPFDSWVGLSNQDDTTIDYNDDGDPMSREERLVREVEWLFQRTHFDCSAL